MTTVNSAFALRDERRIDTLQLTYQAYEHVATGARHIHLATADRNNVFMVALPTLPEDSTGVAHILEHTTLCGSRRFPVRDPFFVMLRRSLNTFMNAFTSSDATAYPFATQNDKDFDNLLAVYLDAVFFPLLNELDFAQEGHRLELINRQGQAPELVFKGVVYNEMKGAMSAPVAQLWQHLHTGLFPTTTYHYNSGGDPREIPTLEYAALKSFHAAHYHPSHAVFMTYGDRDPAEHQAKMQQLALRHFTHADRSWSIGDEQRYRDPQTIVQHYAADEVDAAEHTHIVWGWLLGSAIDLDASMDAHLLSGILLDNSASPLLHYLETTPLAAAPSEICGLEDSNRELVFSCGVEGSSPAHAAQIEGEILDVMARVARDGVAASVIEALIDRMEMSQRDVGGNHYPYGLQLMLRLLPPALHGADPAAFLDIDAALQRLRERAAQPAYAGNLLHTLLLDNPHRVRVTMAPRAGLAAAELAAERQRLADILTTLDDQAVNALNARTQALAARQAQVDDPNVLPKVTLQDVPHDIPRIVGADRRYGAVPGRRYVRGTNGIVYQQVIVPLPALTLEQLDLLPLVADYLTEFGDSRRDYLAAQRDRAAVGALDAHVTVRAAIDDPARLRGYLVIAGKCLARKQAQLAQELRTLFEDARFDEHARLIELIAQARAESDASVTDRGHALAMHATAATFGPAGWLDDRWDGIGAINMIRRLDDSAGEAAAVAGLAAQLAVIARALRTAQPRLLVIAEQDADTRLDDQLSACWSHAGPALPPVALAAGTAQVTGDIAYTTSTQVSFCAAAWRAVPEAHPDAPSLSVLARYLTNGYLHPAIRERGGAYGAGATYATDAAVFQCYSYRDPRLAGTFDDFSGAPAWFLAHRDPQQLEEAILGVVRAIDQPRSPSGEAIRAYFNELHGRSADFLQGYRAAVLGISLAQLTEVCERYLLEVKPVRAAVTSVAAAAEAGPLGFLTRPL